MAPRTTRSKGTAAAPAAPALPSIHTLPPESDSPPKLFILPKKATAEARIVTLPHPRYTAKPARYLVCPETGVYEFTAIAAPKSTPRSWLIEARDDDDPFPAQVTQSADLYVASPVDPLFLMLPALAATATGGKRMFLTPDDHFDALPGETPSHLADLLRSQPATRRRFTARLAAACDTVEAGDEHMYRLSEAKLLAALLAKARRMSAQPLPPSMEAHFVTKALEAPVMSVSRDAPAEGAVNEDGEADVVRTAMQASADVVALQRQRVAFQFLCSRYVPPPLAADLLQRLAAPGGGVDVDWAPLDSYLAQVTALRQEAAQARSAAMDYTRKRVLDEDQDEDDRAEKRRKREEEERRKKASESRGVRDLKKANVRGMKKLSEFFKKK